MRGARVVRCESNTGGEMFSRQSGTVSQAGGNVVAILEPQAAKALTENLRL